MASTDKLKYNSTTTVYYEIVFTTTEKTPGKNISIESITAATSLAGLSAE